MNQSAPDVTAAAKDGPASPAPARRRGWLLGQLRNIAPFVTLLCLVLVFSVASPSFLTLDNLGNILRQVSVVGIIATGLTFVILCAEIDLSVASIANATGILVAFFTMQESFVNIANVPLPGWAAIVLALAGCFALGCVNAFGLTRIGFPSFIMTLAMLQIGAGLRDAGAARSPMPSRR
jgi:ribose transport system permease protein